MHPIAVAAIHRMTRRPSIDIFVKRDVIKRWTPSIIIAYTAVVIPERRPVCRPREYDHRLGGRVDADAFEFGRGVVVGRLVVRCAIGVRAGAVAPGSRVSRYGAGAIRRRRKKDVDVLVEAKGTLTSLRC